MTPRSRWRIIRIVATFIALLSAWLVFSGSFSPVSLAAGVLSAVLISLATFDVFIEEHEVARRSLIPRFLPAFSYPFKLVYAMYVSGFGVLKSVATGRLDPRVVHFRSRLRSDLARVVLAESITFTPGTIVLDLDEDHFIVHWLNATTRHSSRAGDEVKGKLEPAIRDIWA